MSQLEEARILLRKAAEDELLLDKLLADTEIADSTWGFHAQQAVEKILKAVLAWKSIAFPKTHDLAVLYDLLDQHQLLLPVSIDDLDQLTPLAVTYRYDEMESDYTLDRNSARTLVLTIRQWAEKVLQTNELIKDLRINKVVR